MKNLIEIAIKILEKKNIKYGIDRDGINFGKSVDKYCEYASGLSKAELFIASKSSGAAKTSFEIELTRIIEEKISEED